MSKGYVIPDKEGLTSYLDNLVIDYTQEASNIRNGSKKAYTMGIAEGIRRARDAVEHWDMLAEAMKNHPENM
jgi:hypothetical protein